MEPAVFAPKDSTLLTGPVESVATMLSTIAITRHACQNAVPTKFTLIPDPASVWKDSTGLLENARVVDLGRSLILWLNNARHNAGPTKFRWEISANAAKEPSESERSVEIVPAASPTIRSTANA